MPLTMGQSFFVSVRNSLCVNRFFCYLKIILKFKFIFQQIFKYVNEWSFNYGLYYCSQNGGFFCILIFKWRTFFRKENIDFFPQYAFWVLICFSYVVVLLFKSRSIPSHICLFCLTHWFLLLFQKERI